MTAAIRLARSRRLIAVLQSRVDSWGRDRPEKLRSGPSGLVMLFARPSCGCRQVVVAPVSAGSDAKNRNRHCANDGVAVYSQVSAIRITIHNQQIGLGFVCNFANYLRYVATANEQIRVDTEILL